MPRDDGLSGSLGGKTTEELAREFQDVIIDRMEEIEKTNRRLQRMSSFLMLLFAVQIGVVAYFFLQLYKGGMPAWSSQTVSARQFVLHDAQGRVRGVWRLDEDATRLVINDSTGRARLKLSVLADGGAPGISLADEFGVSRAVMGFLPDQTATLVFADRSGNTRAVLGLSRDNSANLVFADRSGATRAGLGVDALGQPTFTLVDQGEGESGDNAYPDTSRSAPAPNR